jgi:diaminohydroxyphosphoribosylaminopyrimidine deaminase/5-amino-6-(5-phosphoribosylamino)uracil reductase
MGHEPGWTHRPPQWRQPVDQWTLRLRDWVHRLRARCDAVIVGGGTVRADDPLLTSRGRRSPEPLRVVMSRSLDLPASARLWQTEHAGTTMGGPWAGASSRQRSPWCSALSEREVVSLSLPVCEPQALLEELVRRGCNQVLWECGPELAAAALRQNCIQALATVISPKLLGGMPARTPVGNLFQVCLGEVPRWNLDRVEALGEDLLCWSLPDRDGS